MRPRRGISGALVACMALAGCGGPGDRGNADGAATRAPVSVAAVSMGPVEERLETFGTFEFDPETTRTLTSERSGEVVEVSVVPGQRVQAGLPLLVLGPVPEGSLEVQRAEIEYDFAREALERVERLAGLRLATNQEVEAARKQLEAARAGLDGLGRNGRERLVVRAPADGVVAELRVGRGSLVQAGQELARIAPAQSMAVRIGFEVEEMPRLAEGLPVLLEPVFAVRDASAIRASLARLHRVADPATQLVEGLIRLEDPPEWAVAGARARARVILQRADDAVRVPRAALVTRGDATGVFVIEDGHVRFQPISLGIQGAEDVQALSGVAVGQLLALQGRTLLSDGMAVREVP